METLNYTEIFKRHGHIEDGTRGEDDRLVCKNCGALMGTTPAGRICPNAEYIHKSVFDREVRSIVTEFGEVKSGKKLAKKVRQFYGRELHDAAQTKVDSLYKTFEEHIRQKPKFVPAILWRVIQRIVLVHYV